MFNKLLFIIKMLFILYPILFIFILAIIGFYIASTIYNYHIFYKKYSICKKQKTHKMLHYLYISDIKMELLDVILLNLGTIGLLLILRYLNFGKLIDIATIFNPNSVTLSGKHIIVMCLIFINFILYMKFLSIVLKYKSYKFYLYLRQYNIFNNIFNILRHQFLDSSTFYVKLYLFLDKISLSTESSKYYFDKNNIEFIIILFIRRKLTEHSKLNLLFENVKTTVESYSFIQPIENTIRKFLLHILLFITLVYDLKHEELKTFYYMLFVYSIILLYRNIIKTIAYYDMFDIDIKLVNYFYIEKTHENLMTSTNNWYERTKVLQKYPDSSDLYDSYSDKIKEYIQRDFIVDYIDIKFKKSHEPYSIRLLYIAILILYLIFIYPSLSQFHILIISIPLLVAIVIYELCYLKYETEINLFFKSVFYFMLVASISIFIWFYLIKFNLHLMQEDFWFFGYNIGLKFDPVEKYVFFIDYLHYLYNSNFKYLSSNIDDLIHALLYNKQFMEQILNSTNIKDIRNLAISLLEISMKVDAQYVGLKKTLHSQTFKYFKRNSIGKKYD